MTHTKDIELTMRAAYGYGLEIGTARIEYDAYECRMVSCQVLVEKRDGPAKWITRKVECLADSEQLPFDDRPLAAMCEALAVQWLESDDGEEWKRSLILTPAERREMAAEHRFDCQREMVA